MLNILGSEIFPYMNCYKDCGEQGPCVKGGAHNPCMRPRGAGYEEAIYSAVFNIDGMTYSEEQGLDNGHFEQGVR